MRAIVLTPNLVEPDDAFSAMLLELGQVAGTYGLGNSKDWNLTLNAQVLYCQVAEFHCHHISCPTTHRWLVTFLVLHGFHPDDLARLPWDFIQLFLDEFQLSIDEFLRGNLKKQLLPSGGLIIAIPSQPIEHLDKVMGVGTPEQQSLWDQLPN